MVTARRYRLFRTGRFPASLRESATGQGVLLAEEGISIRSRHVDLKLPGQNRRSGMRLLVGAMVLNKSTIQLSISHIVLPLCSLSAGDPGGAPVRVRLQADGAHLDVDVSSLVAAGSGTADVHFQVSIDPDLLSSLTGRYGVLQLDPAGAQLLSRRL